MSFQVHKTHTHYIKTNLTIFVIWLEYGKYQGVKEFHMLAHIGCNGYKSSNYVI